jgi:hypothetical protein
MEALIDVMRAALLRVDALRRVGQLALPAAATLVAAVHLLGASSVLLTSGAPSPVAAVAVGLLRWAGLATATWFVAGSFYRAGLPLRTIAGVLAVAHLGLTAALLPIPAAFQIAGALAWAAAIAIRGLSVAVELDLRTASASLALGCLATFLVLAVLPLPAVVAA